MPIVATQIVSIFLAVLYTFLALGSCAVPPPAPVLAVQTEIPREVTHARRLNILSSRGEESHALIRAAGLFMEDHPDSLITVRTISEESDYRSALRARLLGGEQIDLFHIFGHADMIELLEHLDDLSDLGWADEATAGLTHPVRIDGRLYGLPHSLDGVGLIANRRIFEAAGVPLGEITSLEQTEGAFRALREVMTSGALDSVFPNLETVTSLPGLDDDFMSRQLADIALGGEFTSSEQAVNAASIAYLNADPMGLYLAMLARYTTHGRGWAMLVDIPQSEQVENGLAAERVAIIQQSISIFPRLNAANPDLAGDLALLPIFLDDEEPGMVYIHSPVYWAVNASSQDESRALARDFLTWLYRSESGASFLAQEMGLLSPFREAAAPRDNPLDTQLLALIGRGQYHPRRHREFPAGWPAQFSGAIRDYLTILEVDWEEVTERGREDWFYIRSSSWEPGIEGW